MFVYFTFHWCLFNHIVSIITKIWELCAVQFVPYPPPPPIHTPSITFFWLSGLFWSHSISVSGVNGSHIPPWKYFMWETKFLPAAHYRGQIKAQRHYKSAQQAKIFVSYIKYFQGGICDPFTPDTEIECDQKRPDSQKKCDGWGGGG